MDLRLRAVGHVGVVEVPGQLALGDPRVPDADPDLALQLAGHAAGTVAGLLAQGLEAPEAAHLSCVPKGHVELIIDWSDFRDNVSGVAQYNLTFEPQDKAPASGDDSGKAPVESTAS